MFRGACALLFFLGLLVLLGTACGDDPTATSVPQPTPAEESSPAAAAADPSPIPSLATAMGPTSTAAAQPTTPPELGPTAIRGPDPAPTREPTATATSTREPASTTEPTLTATSTREPAPTSEPTPTATPTLDPAAVVAPAPTLTEDEESSARDLNLSFDEDTTWQEVFDGADAAVQKCIRGALGEGVSAELERSIGNSYIEEFYDCLDPETAGDIFLIIFVQEIGGADWGLNEPEVSCVLDGIAGIDLAAVVVEDPNAFGDLFRVVFACAPDPFINSFVDGFGIEQEELSEEELACVREELSEPDIASLFDLNAYGRGEGYSLISKCAPVDTVAAEIGSFGFTTWEFSAREESCFREWEPTFGWADSVISLPAKIDQLFSVMFDCAPEQAASQLISRMSDSYDLGFTPDEVSEANASCFRERTANTGWGGLYTWESNLHALGAFVKTLFLCAPDLLIKRTAERYGLSDSEIGEAEVACLKEWANSFDWARLLIENPYTLEKFESGTKGCFQNAFAAKDRDAGE